MFGRGYGYRFRRRRLAAPLVVDPPVDVTAPTNTTPPAIAGDLIEGSTLTRTPGVWSDGTVEGQWLAGGVPDGAGATFDTTDDVGASILYRERATDTAGNTSAWVNSNTIGPIEAAAPPADPLALEAEYLATSVPDGAAAGVAIATLTPSGGTAPYTLEVDHAGFAITGGNQLVTGLAPLSYTDAAVVRPTITCTDAAAAVVQVQLAVDVVQVDAPAPPYVPEAPPVATPDFEAVTVSTVNGQSKGRAKKPDPAGYAKIVFPFPGTIQPGFRYTIEVDPDYALLSNLGVNAFCGFALKEGNDFHFLGAAGDGSTGLVVQQLYGSSFTAAPTTIGHGPPLSGTQEGPSHWQLDVAADGSTVTLRSGGYTAGVAGSPQWVSGDRRGSIAVTGNFTPFAEGTFDQLVDGLTGAGIGLNTADGVYGSYINFDFGASPAQLTGHRIVLGGAFGEGAMWEWRGSNEDTATPAASSFQTISLPFQAFRLNGTTEDTSTLGGNTASFRHYRVVHVSGARLFSAAGAARVHEISFRAVTGAYLDFAWTDEITAAATPPIAPSTDATTFGVGLYVPPGVSGEALVSVRGYQGLPIPNAGSRATRIVPKAGTVEGAITGVTVVFPAHVAGDRLLAIGEYANDDLSILTGTGWTLAHTTPGQGTAGAVGAVRGNLWTKIAESNAEALILNSTGNHEIAAGINLGRNAEIVSITSASRAAGATITFPAATTADPDCTVLNIAVSDLDSTTPSFSGWTNAGLEGLVELLDGGSVINFGGSIGVAYGYQAPGTTGTTGETVVTHTSAAEAITIVCKSPAKAYETPVATVTLSHPTPVEGVVLTGRVQLAGHPVYGSSHTFQWLRNGVAISGASGTFTTNYAGYAEVQRTPVLADVGATLALRVTPTTLAQTGNAVTSAASLPVLANTTFTAEVAGTPAAGAGTAAVNLSPQWPAHVPGDVIAIPVSTANEAIVPPAGWTTEHENGFGTAAAIGAVRGALLWKRVTSSAEPAAILADAGSYTLGVPFVIRGAKATGNPFVGIASSQLASPGSPFNLPGMTTTGTNQRVFHILFGDNDSSSPQCAGFVNANLSGLTKHFDGGTVNGVGGTITIISGVMAAPGATGNLAFTSATGQAITSAIAMVFAIEGAGLANQAPAQVTRTFAEVAYADPTRAARVSRAFAEVALAMAPAASFSYSNPLGSGDRTGTITATTGITTATGSAASLVDGVTNSGGITWPAVLLAGNEVVFTLTWPDPIAASELRVHQAGTASLATTLKFQITTDGTTWFDVSDTKAWGGATVWTVPLPGYHGLRGVRLLRVSGTMAANQIYEIELKTAA